MNNIDVNMINPVPLFASLLINSVKKVGVPFDEREVKYYEMELIIETGGWIDTEGQRIDAISGDVFFRKPGMIVQGFSGYSAYLISFDISYNEENLDMYDFISPFNPDLSPLSTKFDVDLPYKFNYKNINEQKKLFNNMYHLYINKNQQTPILMKALLMQSLSHYIHNCQSQPTAVASGQYRYHHHAIYNAQKYVQSNIHRHISLDELACEAKLSKNFFCKAFKFIIGKTAFEYINQERIRLAQQYLITSYKSIEEISVICGFKEKSYFYRLFKRYTGETPLQYRKKSNQPYYLK